MSLVDSLASSKVFSAGGGKVIIVMGSVAFEAVVSPNLLATVLGDQPLPSVIPVDLRWSAEGGPSLYAFLDRSERTWYHRVMEADRVGPGVAMKALRVVDDLPHLRQDPEAFRRLVDACGEKTAGKIAEKLYPTKEE